MKNPPEPRAARMPVGFVSHGAPTLALDAVKGGELQRWAASMPEPTALLVVSAHWEQTPLAIGTEETGELIYDFGGFDARLYQQQYRAPGAPWLAERVHSLFPEAARTRRGWDHGVWVPLVHMYPRADVPLLQLSLPSHLATGELFSIGRRLGPLRDEGVLLLASGGMVHNLRRLDWAEQDAPPAWATGFESWAKEALLAHDVDRLLDLRHAAPDLQLAHPTLEHILPLIVALGAVSEHDPITFPIEGFEYGSLSRTSVQFGR